MILSLLSPLYVRDLRSQSLDFFFLGSDLSTKHLLQGDQLLLLGQDLVFLIMKKKIPKLFPLRLVYEKINEESNVYRIVLLV